MGKNRRTGLTPPLKVSKSSVFAYIFVVFGCFYLRNGVFGANYLIDRHFGSCIACTA